jgi:hypothetical protein
MIRVLRDLAGLWADSRYIKANDVLRRRLIAAGERLDRQADVHRRDAMQLSATAEALSGCRRQRDRAERQRDAAWAELELVRPVVVAAQAWREAVAMVTSVGVDYTIDDANRASEALMAAVRALPTTSGTVPANPLGGNNVRS